MAGKFKDANRRIDEAVGHNLRMRRQLLGVSQQELAEEIGVSFQQIQKYERGANRMSASALWRICGVMKCTVADMFSGIADAPPGSTDHGVEAADAQPERVMQNLLNEAGGLDMAQMFMALGPEYRRALLDAAKAFVRVSASDEAGAT